MAFENKLAAVLPQAFTANGTSLGVVTIADTTGFYIKQYVNLKSDTLQEAAFQVKNVLSNTQLILGPNNNNLIASPKNVSDVSVYTVVDGATILAPEQNNFNIPQDDHYATVYMPAPLMADRVVPVDPHGNFYTINNPLPVSGGSSSGIVEVNTPANIILTLGALGIPDYLQLLLAGTAYDTVISTTVGNIETLNFTQDGTSVEEITISKTTNGWTITQTYPMFLLQEDGFDIVLEDGSGDILLEG